MMQDLFASDVRFTPVPIPDADVCFLTHLPLDMSDEEVFLKLRNETIWQHEEVVVWGKKHLQPRLTAWYGDPGQKYAYSGTEMNPLPWTNLLLYLKRRVEELSGAEFNSVLLNLYRDHRDRMGFHSDNERELGAEPVIASLSFGETRTLLFKHKRRKDLPLKPVTLTSGSLLLMKGRTQQNWNHGINSESAPCGARINLTFRRIFAKTKNDAPKRRERSWPEPSIRDSTPKKPPPRLI
ncbi:MAG TPA: alpha-ketoglutarate-dependent dioxygenase AlkB [Allosphingosinicella sp.]|nr:alpha-ketoglutarate-dependent dioxygenase AlkB [Allosphingosinicella sp.]